MYTNLISSDGKPYMLASDIEAYNKEYGAIYCSNIYKSQLKVFIDPLVSFITSVCRAIDYVTVVKNVDDADIIVIPNTIPYDNSTGGFQNWFWMDDSTLKGWQGLDYQNCKEFISDGTNITRITKKVNAFIKDRLFSYPKERLVSLSQFSNCILQTSSVPYKTILNYLESSDSAINEMGCVLFLQNGFSMNYFDIIQTARNCDDVFCQYVRHHPQYRIALDLILPNFFETTFYTHLQYIFSYTKKQQDEVLTELSKRIINVSEHISPIIRFCSRNNYKLNLSLFNCEKGVSLQIPYKNPKEKRTQAVRIDGSRIFRLDLDMVHSIDVYSEFFNNLTTAEQELLLSKLEEYVKANLLQSLSLYDHWVEKMFTVKLIKE